MDETMWKNAIQVSRKSAVIFMGLQASGKSEFYRRYFVDTHTRISLDEVHTRSREKRLLEECVAAGRSFAVDNTNPTAADRARYIAPAKAAGYHVTGVYFSSPLKECMARNAPREGKARVPDIAIAATAAKLEAPVLSEGFDELYYVSIEDGEFRIEKRGD